MLFFVRYQRRNSLFSPAENDIFPAVKTKVRTSLQPYQMIKTQPHIARQSAKKDVTPYAPMVVSETYCKSMCYGNNERHQLTLHDSQ